jgi:hypothetical protein
MSFDSGPATKATPVTPSDSTDLSYPCRALYVGATGDVTAVVNGAAVLFKAVPVGILPVRVSRVNSTGTTATNIVALF